MRWQYLQVRLGEEKVVEHIIVAILVDKIWALMRNIYGICLCPAKITRAKKIHIEYWAWKVKNIFWINQQVFSSEVLERFQKCSRYKKKRIRGKNKFWEIPILKLTLFPFLLRRDWFLKDRLFNTASNLDFITRRQRQAGIFFIKVIEFRFSLYELIGMFRRQKHENICCFEL